MRSIAIILGDNDFGNTMRPLLANIAAAIEDSTVYMDEAFVTRLIHEGMMFHYMAYQNHGSYGNEAHREHIAQYLREGVKVLFDEQADQAYYTEDHDSGAWHILLADGGVNPF